MGKIRGAIVDALEVASGEMTLQNLAGVLHRKRARDIRRRNLPALEVAGIIVVEGDRVTLAGDWLDKLEAAREIGGELEAEKLARRRYRDKSRAYHNRDKPLVSKPSAAGYEAVRKSLEKAREYYRNNLTGWVEEEPTPLSPLAVAVRTYLERQPHQARQPAGWIGVALWAEGLHPKLDNPPMKIRAAVDELGGAAYLDRTLKQSKVVA